jgi:beta-galactosidase
MEVLSMFFNEIIHGTQYYRTPTPLPEEWEGDIKNLEEYNIDSFQIRMNWRWNERVEGEYDFSDVDRLLQLAEKNGRRVIMKFLLECAPQYVYEKYGGTRIGPLGELLRPGSHGAFYGGWRPCFTNPLVWERALKFVDEVAKRYAGNKNIILWNAWNEIRNRPIEECYCPHCRSAFGKYLKEKFGTIENLNKHYGAAEESFETVNLPVMPHGFWDIYEFKKFKSSYELHRYLKQMYDVIRKYDKNTPIMSHAGFASAFQTNIGDAVDDYNVSRAVDFWGTSLPFDTNMDCEENRISMMQLCDFMRSVDKNYFNHEIYPGLGMFRDYDTPFDMKFKLYTALSHGSKGLVYWQYKAERVGMEQDCAGIMRADGSPRPVAYEVKKFGEDLHKNMRYFLNTEVKGGKAAIVFDYDSMLMSEIEDACGENFKFKLKDGTEYYLRSHRGAYELFKRAGYAVDYVGASRPEEFRNYKLLYFPYHSMLDNKIVPYLEKFLEDGGTLLLDEGFGLRDLNTWMRVGDINLKPIIDARITERRFTLEKKEYLDFLGERVRILPYKTEITAKNAEVISSFENGLPAIQLIRRGKGKVYLFGIPLGYSYKETNAEVYEKFINTLMSELGIEECKFEDFKGGIYEKRLLGDGYEIAFIFNTSDKDRTFMLDGDVIAYGGGTTVEERKMTVRSGDVGYSVFKKVK